MLDVTFTTVLYESDWERTCGRVCAVLKSLQSCGLTGEYLIVDNSSMPTPGASLLAVENKRVQYTWNQGYNIYLAGALELAVSQAKGQTFVYVCASHGVVKDDTWLTDLISSVRNESTALAGSVQPCEFNRVASVPDDIVEPQVHVQGGIWASRTKFLQKIGFSHRFPFEFCDVDLSRRCLVAGYDLVDVPSIASVADGTVPESKPYKYIHDYR